MENHNTSPTNNATNNMSKDNLISDNHINELPIRAVFSNKNTNGEYIKSEDIEALMKSFPPGFRFYPTDYELIKYYLERKLANLPLQPNKIYELNIYNYHPDTIAESLNPSTAEKVWYIFTPRDRKYPNGNRPGRSAGDGYWKATGADKIINDDKNSKIGSKRSLVYYIGKSPKGQKTNWIMHEYMVPKIPDISKRDPKNSKLDEWVLCRLYNKKDVITSMFTQIKRSRENDEPINDEVEHNDPTNSEGTYEDSTGNGRINYCNNNTDHAIMFSEGTYQDFTGNGLTNFNNNNNHATMFLEDTDNNNQVLTGLSTFPQHSYMPAFCNYQSCVLPQFNNDNASGIIHEGTSMTNDVFHQPLMIEPISSMEATNNFIGHDHTMNNEGFDVSFFTSCIGGDYGEYLEHEQYYSVDQYFADNQEMGIVSSDYNTNNFVNGETTTSNNFVNGETSTSKGDC